MPQKADSEFVSDQGTFIEQIIGIKEYNRFFHCWLIIIVLLLVIILSVFFIFITSDKINGLAKEQKGRYHILTKRILMLSYLLMILNILCCLVVIVFVFFGKEYISMTTKYRWIS